ncbi:MAG: hypothetical protein Q8P40_04885 [Nitrospirota bacterium]|nr:hypothetical protein [Nitrospirota bacterium]
MLLPHIIGTASCNKAVVVLRRTVAKLLPHIIEFKQESTMKRQYKTLRLPSHIIEFKRSVCMTFAPQHFCCPLISSSSNGYGVIRLGGNRVLLLPHIIETASCNCPDYYEMMDEFTFALSYHQVQTIRRW